MVTAASLDRPELSSREPNNSLYDTQIWQKMFYRSGRTPHCLDGVVDYTIDA
jgi:hypothetical protein